MQSSDFWFVSGLKNYVTYSWVASDRIHHGTHVMSLQYNTYLPKHRLVLYYSDIFKYCQFFNIRAPNPKT